MLLGEEIRDRFRHHITDTFDRVELLGGLLAAHRLQESVKRVEIAREQLRRRFADMGNAQRKDETVERDLPARVDGREQLGRRLSRPTLRALAIAFGPLAYRSSSRKMSAGSFSRPSSKNSCTVLSPRPSMSNAYARREMVEPLHHLRRT